MPMVRKIGGAEDDTPSEDRQNPPLALGHVAIPQLQMPAPLLMPLGIEIYEQIEPTIEFQPRMSVKVRVEFEKSSSDDLMNPAAPKMRIGNKAANSGQCLEEIDEYRGIQLIQQGSRGVAELSFDFGGKLLAARVVKFDPTDLARSRNLCEHTL